MHGYFFSYIDDIPKTMRSTLFSLQHFIAIGLVVCVWVVLLLVFKNRSYAAKWKFVLVLSLLLPLFEAAQMIWYKAVGQFSWGYTLPLHLCSLMSVILPVMAVSRNKLLQEYAYAMGLAPALMTLLTPDVYYYPALSFIYIQTMVVHGLICFIPLFLIFGMGFKPNIRNLPRVTAMLIGFAVLNIPVNYFTDGNYFFLRYPAAGSPMEAFAEMVGSPWYLIPTFLLGCVLWLVLYLPFVIVGWNAKHRQVKQEEQELIPKEGEKQHALHI